MKSDKKKSENVPKQFHSPSHVFKLLNKITEECSSNLFNAEGREVIKQGIKGVSDIMEDMEKRDEDFQNLPENKIKNLKSELETNERILRKNKEGLRMQIQQGLYQKGYPMHLPFFDTVLEQRQFAIEDINIKLQGLDPVNPVFRFQTDPKWVELQRKINEKNLKATKEDMAEIQQQVDEVKKEIEAQNERIISRKSQIIDELKKLGQDTSGYEKPDYVG